MNSSVVLTRRAQRDLMKLYDYIAERSGEGRADGYINRIQEFFRSLGAFPMRGVRRDDLKKGLRVIGFERRVAIAFQITDSDVIVARVSCTADAILPRPSNLVEAELDRGTRPCIHCHE